MFYYLVTAHFLLTQTIKYSYQCINLLKTQNDSNTPSNLVTSLKVISMIGGFSRVYTSSVHVMNGEKSVQQSITKAKWFEVPCPHDLLPHSNPPHFELYFRYFFSFYFSMLSTYISIVSIYWL